MHICKGILFIGLLPGLFLACSSDPTSNTNETEESTSACQNISSVRGFERGDHSVASAGRYISWLNIQKTQVDVYDRGPDGKYGTSDDGLSSTVYETPSNEIIESHATNKAGTMFWVETNLDHSTEPPTVISHRIYECALDRCQASRNVIYAINPLWNRREVLRIIQANNEMLMISANDFLTQKTALIQYSLSSKVFQTITVRPVSEGFKSGQLTRTGISASYRVPGVIGHSSFLIDMAGGNLSFPGKSTALIDTNRRDITYLLQSDAVISKEVEVKVGNTQQGFTHLGTFNPAGSVSNQVKAVSSKAGVALIHSLGVGESSAYLLKFPKVQGKYSATEVPNPNSKRYSVLDPVAVDENEILMTAQTRKGTFEEELWVSRCQ